MLGTDLVDHLRARHDVIAVDMDVDVTDAGAVVKCVGEVAPDAIIHCAAWTDVDGAEEREDDALRLNGDSTRIVATAAATADATFIYPSTDYVFDGQANRPYREDDVTAPLGAYGRTKLAGERAAREVHPTGTRVARTAWLYGASGPNFIDTMRRLGSEREKVSVVADQFGCPTWTRELAPALEALIEQPPGIYHTAAGGYTSWADLARRVFQRAQIDCEVESITTEEFGRPAPRPEFSALTSTVPGAPRLRAWEEAVDDYLRSTS